jgi:hypothetical protein
VDVSRTLVIGYIGRSTVLWVLTRTAMIVVVRFAPGATGTDDLAVRATGLDLAPPAAMMGALVVAILVLLDVRALRERVFLANLGISLRSVAVLAFLSAASLEALVAAVLALRP